MKYRNLKAYGKWLLVMGLVLFGGYGLAQHPAAVRQQADSLYQEATALFDQQQDSLALARYRQARAIYRRQQWIVPQLADACLNIGILLQIQEKYPQAIAAYKESVQHRNKILPRQDADFIYPLLLIASCYTVLNQYDSAHTYYGQVEPLLLRYPDSPHALRFYNSMGALYYSYGNYVQSINYFEKAFQLLEAERRESRQPDPLLLARYVVYTTNMASALSKLGQYRQAIAQIKKLIGYGFIPNILYQHIAAAYLQLNQPDSARAYLRKINIGAMGSHPIPIPGSSGVNPIKAEIEYYSSLGTLALQEKNGPQALAFFDKAREVSLAHFGPQNERLASAYAGKAQAYALQQQYGAAAGQYRLALQTLHFNFQAPDAYGNPQDLHNIVSPLLLFKILGQQAQTWQQAYGHTRKLSALQAALQTYEAAFQLAGLIRKGYDSDKAKLFFLNTVSPLYEEALATAFQLFDLTGRRAYLETAFALAEQSKAAVLAESLRALEIRQVPGISARLLRQERALKQSIAALNLNLVESNDPGQKEKYRDHLRENEIRLAQTLKELENNQQYYQLKYDTRPVRVQAIRAGLDSETAFLEYFVGSRHLYVFVITRQGFEARRLGPTAAFTRDWQALYQALYQAQPGFRYRGDQPAHRLYRQLLAPVAASLAGKRRLVIIPDKELGYLPFEALVAELPRVRYLLQDYTVSYAYSGKLLDPGAGKAGLRRQATIMALAPFAHGHTGQLGLRADRLTPLYASAEEVKQIGGQVYLGPEATKERLLQQVGQYDILHLATHAKANSQEPLHSYIAFYPGKKQAGGYRLYVPEIYNLRLDKLKLVVLSACETGGGQLVKGEGIMSLARAFAYAGCPSTVTTLWKAEDKTTAYISTRLYEYLKAGKPKDEALQLAKLDYLENQPNWRQRSPVYWANFIFIGDVAPVYTNYAFLWWWLAAFLAVLAGWYFYQRRRARRYRFRKRRDAALARRLQR